MKKLIIGLVIALCSIVILGVSIYNYCLTPVDKNDNKNISFVVTSGEGKKEIIKNLKNKKIILLDDIYTTGSTVKACVKELKKGKPQTIDVLVIAKRN